MRLETPRLVIRTIESRDAEAWIAMMADPDVRRFLPNAPTPTLESFNAAVERRHAMERERGHAFWAVDSIQTEAFVGQCGLLPVEDSPPEIELGYHFNKSSWNKGFATEAAIAVLGWGFHTLGITRIIARALTENVASFRVMEKAGMRFERTATYRAREVKVYVAERTSWSEPASSTSDG